MKFGPPSTIEAVVSAHLCTGCGVCSYLHPGRLEMVDIDGVGRRPLPIAEVTGGTRGAGVAACPGRDLRHDPGALDGAPFRGEWGPVLGLYECWSTDSELRFRGSSGGAASALAGHAVTSGAAHGVLQIRASSDRPLHNEAVLNRTYAEIVRSAGSRYAPASPCERLDLVESAPGPCVVIGKPCDVAATRRAAELRPALAEKVGLTVAFFCAGTPSTRATADAIKDHGVEPTEVDQVDYRGEGWPGHFRVRTSTGEQATMTGEEAWGGVLTKPRHWRCLDCPDHTGEFADLSVGDPWCRETREVEPGSSLVIRTERGRAALAAALEGGALDGVELPVERLRLSPPSSRQARGELWGRVLTMPAQGLPTPRYRGMPSFRPSWRLPLAGKRTSALGTRRRARRRSLRRPEVGR